MRFASALEEGTAHILERLHKSFFPKHKTSKPPFLQFGGFLLTHIVIYRSHTWRHAGWCCVVPFFYQAVIPDGIISLSTITLLI